MINDKSIINDLSIINDKSIKIKKNLNIFKKDKIIKIKSNIPIKKSMIKALEDKEVLLWGINRIDSILLELYDKEYIKSKKNKSKENKSEENKLEENKTIDTEYIPKNKYYICDIDFLNLEYDKIEKKIGQMIDLNDEYNYLLDLQDSLTDLINELQYNNIKKIKQIDLNSNSNSDLNSNSNSDLNSNSNSDLNKNVSNKVEKKIYKKKINKILKPYFLIGNIPEGYREATEEEAIISKKVSLYGKIKVQSELYSLFEITGSIYINLNDIDKLNQQIIALKGKLRFYKKEHIYNKISLESDNISLESEIRIKNKIFEIENCYKKTIEILNLYVKQYEKIKNQNNKIIKTNIINEDKNLLP
jgi:hypothetical protein